MRVRSSIFTLLLVVAASPLRAAVFWDIDTTNKAGAGGSAPSGIWSAIKADWNPNADGTGIPTIWTPGETAIFAAGTGATGAYTVTVSGTQSLSGLTVEEGTVTQSGGTLDFGSAASSIYMSAGATWVQNTASVFAGTGGLYKNGPGTLVLRGANTFSNSGSANVPFLTINEGIVDFNAGVSLGAAPPVPNNADIVINGGTFRYTGSQLTLSSNRGILIGDTGATIETTTGLLALPATASSTAALTGTGTITKTGVGRLELQTSQTTFTGKYIVKNGSLGITADGTLGAVPTTNQADYFTLDGGGIYGDNANGITLDPKRGITLGPSGGFLAFNGTGLNPYDGIISGTAGGGLRIAVDDAVSANSAGVVTLNSANTYNGPTEIDTNATLIAATIANGGTNSSIGKSSNAVGNLIFSGGTLRYTGADVSTDRGFTLTQAGGFIEASGANNAALKFTSSATMGVSGTGPRVLVLRGTSTGDNTMSLAIVDQGTNPTTVNKTDAGTWVLTNTANSYTGNTAISVGGRLKLGASGVIPDASLVQLFSSSVFDLNGFNETVRSVSGTSGTIALGAKSLTLNNPNGEIYSASITGAGGGKIIKNGTGKFTLSPTTATYDGGVTLNAGVLGIGTSAALGIGTLIINNSVSLDNVATSALTLSNAVTLNGDVSFNDAFIANPGAITWGTSGANKWTIAGGNRTISVTTSAGGYGVTINQVVSEDFGDLALLKSGNGTLTLTAANTYTGYTNVLGGALTITKPYLADWSGVMVAGGATLNLNFAPGTIDVIDALCLDGLWQTETGTWGALGSGAQHETALISGPGMLRVTPFVVPLAGDFNGDGRVDTQDFVLWRKDPAAHGGAPGYDTWRQNFGKSSGAGAGSTLAQAGVPEPGTIVLLPITTLALMRIRNRRRVAAFIAAVQRG